MSDGRNRETEPVKRELASGSEAGRRRARLRRRGVAGWWRRKAPLPLPPWAGRTGEALWAGSEAHRGGLTHSAGVPWGRASEGFGNGNLRPPGLLQMQIDLQIEPWCTVVPRLSVGPGPRRPVDARNQG